MHEMTIEAQHIDAIFLDLDGVVTSTARVHAAAWKATFDAFLEARDGQAFEPFDEVQDYALYVDGRLRQDGVRTFLASRGISLPLGRAEDAPSFQTVWGLGNRKNGLFRELLSSRGVDVYDDARDFIKRLRSVGIICGLVSASRNCRLIVSKSGLAPLFDIIIDGNDAERLGLRGKPAPDMFLAAAKGMGIKPDRACVIEDAPAGIEAANAGGFRLAILVSRKGGEPDSRAGCATVRSLAEIDVEGLPSASESLDEIAARIQDKPHAVLLDYDGTLTPIVARPELAVLSERMRGVLSSLAEQCPTGIVTGRSLAEIRRLVGVDLSFIASHGMEQQIKGCAAEEHAPPGVAAKISQAADALQQKLGRIGGVIVERKPFSVAVHYRL
ncbi:MAG: trehalose-phosphatase, partial [Hyphomicrobiaceae bacterium]